MNNESKLKDEQYIYVVKDIIDNEEFNKTKEIVHHGLNRFDHCLRVSYYSYKISKFLRLDHEKVARAGLLHDFFFIDNNNIDITKRLDVLINHPKYAITNSKRYFELSDKEEDMIASHMFPVSFKLPRYMESWVVDIVDNVVAVGEALYSTRKYLGVAVNFLILILLNYWR